MVLCFSSLGKLINTASDTRILLEIELEKGTQTQRNKREGNTDKGAEISVVTRGNGEKEMGNKSETAALKRLPLAR